MDLDCKFEVDPCSIKVKNNKKLLAFIDLENGGSLQHLKLNGLTVIEKKNILLILIHLLPLYFFLL